MTSISFAVPGLPLRAATRSLPARALAAVVVTCGYLVAGVVGLFVGLERTEGTPDVTAWGTLLLMTAAIGAIAALAWRISAAPLLLVALIGIVFAVVRAATGAGLLALVDIALLGAVLVLVWARPDHRPLAD
ncbi:hypothetical protein GIS00_14000 [Nakamurella sp. YIM 132087]|uniref:Uncharacterized protein n=1 Tax=Nakamurella alba TaxID=2665158 RepID=A0A7K1FPA4_9ACTN|nr:hypothetical protein [Nakamurella alba]MTD15053.1 hypothetical protein [Nakamurella alba]